MNPWEILDHVADLVLTTDGPELGERALKVMLASTGGHRAALFERVQGDLRLFASRGVDQAVLEAVRWAWANERDRLLGGHAWIADAEPSAPSPMKALFADAPWLGILPVMDVARLTGLLYVEAARTLASRELVALEQFARVAARALSWRREAPGITAGLAAYVEKTPIDEIARDQLLVLMERHEWNIAKVARVLGVTRPTVYDRLERYGIARRRLIKGVKRQPA